MAGDEGSANGMVLENYHCNVKKMSTGRAGGEDWIATFCTDFIQEKGFNGT